MGVIIVIGLESGDRLKERAGNGGGYTLGEDVKWRKLSKLSSKKKKKGHLASSMTLYILLY